MTGGVEVFWLGLLIGLPAGGAILWFLLRSTGRTGTFEPLLESELSMAARAGSLQNLKKRVEQLESRMNELEQGWQRRPVDAERADGPAARPRRTGKSRHAARVANLWEQGWTVGDIARETALGRGEVELILALKQANLGKAERKPESLEQEGR
jgi:hypothetical protein